MWPDPPRLLDLTDAIDIALCDNPQLKHAIAEIRLQAAALGEARAAYLPRLSLSTSELESRTRDAFGDQRARGLASYGTLTWRVLDFGGRSANIELADRLLDAASATRDATIQRVLAHVVSAYFDAVTAQAAERERARSLELAELTLGATRRRSLHGSASHADIAQASAAHARAALARSRAQGELDKARAVLLNAMGRSSEQAVRLPDALPAPRDDEAVVLDAWLEHAKHVHPAIVAARAQADAAQAKIGVARAEALPTLDLNWNVYRNGYPNQGLSARGGTTTTIGLTLTIPLFDGFARIYGVRRAQAQSEQTSNQLEETRLQIDLDIVKARADVQAARRNVLASQALLVAAMDAAQSAQRRYDHGAADIVERLRAEDGLADAQQERIRCLAEWHSARLRLKASMGMLGRGAFE
ncbi:TolC family protein [Pararobbsia silviterrae]|uniref:TolC family protein n=1 Tax=Pararobbsia silviterrae TaxID=1792498 RepID=UPI001314DB6A|nr:TolC family protein [Pararobbsia silviterrae]